MQQRAKLKPSRALKQLSLTKFKRENQKMNETLTLQEVITKNLKELGVQTNYKGYYYLRYAIALMVNDMTYIDSITTKLYPAVAQEYKTTASRAERAIRYAIETSWNRANTDFADKLFGYSVNANKGKPTNSEFITTIADYILLSKRETKV